MNTEINFYFPSIFLRREIDNFHNFKDDLTEKIYKFSQDNCGIKVSNCGGWHSKNILDEKVFEKYSKLIFEYTKESLSNILYNSDITITNMWININKPGDFNRTHVHTKSDFSGVLWIDIDNGECGNIEFDNPNIFEQEPIINKLKPEIKNQFNVHEIIWMRPKEGVLILFPSHIRHMVLPNNSYQNRISISFNVSLN